MKRPTASTSATVASLAALSAALAFGAGTWDGESWVYTPETHRAVVPNTGECTVLGLDAKARGLGATGGADTVDKWYWTRADSNVYPICFDQPGMIIVVE